MRKNDSMVCFKLPSLLVYLAFINSYKELSKLIIEKKDDLEWQKDKSNNLNMSKWLDVEEYKLNFCGPKTKIKSHFYFREIEEVKMNLDSIGEYFKVDFSTYSQKQFIKFLNKVYFKKFKNITDFYSLNLYDIGLRGLELRLSSLKNIQETLRYKASLKLNSGIIQ